MNVNKSHNILRWFKRLEDWNISYYLLRPLDLKKDEKDIDIIVSESDVKILTQKLKTMDFDAAVTTSVAENSVGILLNGELLLDIKTKVCFFSSKFYAFKTPPPYSSIKLENNGLVYPRVQDEELFTFWILHFFLDKKHPSMSSSYETFCKKYESNAEEMLNSSFCQKWLYKVFGRRREDADYILRQFCKNNFQTTLELSRFTKELILRRDLKTLSIFYLEKIKYAIIRRTKREFYTPIAAYQG